MITVNKKELYSIFKNAINTSSSDIFLTDLNSVHFDCLYDNTLNIVFTDSKQMAIYKINYIGKKINSFTIKSKNIKELLKHININSIDKNTYITIDDSCYNYIKIDDKVYEKINNFPPYKIAIPDENTKYKKLYNVILDNKQMMEIKKAVTSLKKLSKAKSKRLIMKFNNNNLVLTIADYADYDIHNISNIVIENIKSNIEHTLNINYHHLLNILSQVINKDDNNKITIEIYKNSYVPLKILHNNTVFLIMLMGEDEEHNNIIEEYIKQFTENSIKESETIKIKQTRQQRRFIEREKAKKHILRFIDYINSIKIIDYKAMELIKYIDSLNITDDEKISLFNIKYKKPYTRHITDTTKIDILKTA